MNTETIELLINKLGLPYDTLVNQGAIPNLPLQELYPGRDWLDIRLEPGLELTFWAESKKLEKLFIGLLATPLEVSVYKGKLPQPFASISTQIDARKVLGEPIESKGPMNMPKPIGQTGGWDIFKLDATMYPNIKVVCQYDASLQIDTLVFMLINSGDA